MWIEQVVDWSKTKLMIQKHNSPWHYAYMHIQTSSQHYAISGRVYAVKTSLSLLISPALGADYAGTYSIEK